jgi:CRP/FNR family transcriptional regulator, dissimilatory nitrate respiration regulator
MIVIMSKKFFDLLGSIPANSREIRKGALLFEQGDLVQTLTRVDDGEIHLLRRQIDGAEFILQRATKGSIIAEASLMTETYHCAAIAIVASRLTYWPRNVVRARIAQDNQLAEAYAAHLATEVRTARLRAEIASLRRIQDRLDAWLIWHDGTLPVKGGWHILAREINVTPEALYRELARRRKAVSP